MIVLYIDPGSGSLLFQALMSGAIAVALFYKKIVAYIRFKLGLYKDTDSTKDDTDIEN